MIRSAFAVSSILVCVGLGVSPEARREMLVLRGGTLIDGTDAAPVVDAVVVIEGNRIQAAGPRSRIQIPAGATIIQTDGQYIIPGLIDAHVHYWDWMGELLLYHGVTSVVDMGNFSDYMVALADSIDKGMDTGPRIFAGGEFLRGSKPHVGNLQAQVFLTNEQEVREKVRELVGKGMKFIKVMGDMPIEHVAAAIDEARKLGVPVTGHSPDVVRSVETGLSQVVHAHEAASGAIKDPNRRRAFEERSVSCPSSLMDSEGMDTLVALMVGRGVYFGPALVQRDKMFSRRAHEHEMANVRLLARNDLQYVPMEAKQGLLSSYHRHRDQRRSGGLPEPGFVWSDELTPEALDEFRRCHANNQEFLRRFVAADGLVTSGTDTPSTSLPGAGLHHEMEMLAEAGMTPLQVLQATTVNTARFLRMEDTLGTVTAGKLADLLVLSADPLTDISNTQKIARVIKNGRVVERRFHKEYDAIIKRPLGRQVHVMPDLFRPSTMLRRGVVTGLTPGMTTEGSADLEISVEGAGFSSSSVVRLANNRLKTTYLGPERLRALVPARLLQVAGTYPVTVESPAPGGGISNEYGLIVRFR